MTSEIKIRQELTSDHGMIYSVTEAAFKGKAYAGGDEQIIVDRLRKSGRLSLSLVAHIDDAVVGHIAFSPAKTRDNSQSWFALGPVSVLPKYQGNGIGAKLIRLGLTQVQRQRALGCILTGNPEYYRKFNFELAPEYAPSDSERDHFMLMCFTKVKPNGPLLFDPAFYGEI